MFLSCSCALLILAFFQVGAQFRGKPVLAFGDGPRRRFLSIPTVHGLGPLPLHYRNLIHTRSPIRSKQEALAVNFALWQCQGVEGSGNIFLQTALYQAMKGAVCRRSSGVERALGKGEVECSIHSGGTSVRNNYQQ